VSNRFRIHKIDGEHTFPWMMDYPDGFVEFGGPRGVACSRFSFAVDEFIRAAERQCPMCLRGAVVDTDWGWRCTACGASDVAWGVRHRQKPLNRRSVQMRRQGGGAQCDRRGPGSEFDIRRRRHPARRPTHRDPLSRS
jgi:hypothetical protein